MIVKSMRLGDIEVSADKMISMVRPILGFEQLETFCLIEVSEFAPFLWLQSIQNEAVAFAVVNPLVFWPEYKIEINSKEIAELKVSKIENVETYIVVSFDDQPKNISANLQGPILVNSENNRAKQLVLVNSEYGVRHSIMEAIPEPPVVTAPEAELTPA